MNVRHGSVDASIAEPLLEVRWDDGTTIVAHGTSARLDISGVARYAVDDGEDVVIDADPDADPREVDLHLRGTVRAFLMAQRGRFALHANANRIGDGATALCGEQGAGKSTTSVRLHQRGLPLVSDDVSPVVMTDAGLMLEPTGRALRLAPQAIERLALDAGDSEPLPRTGKVELEVPPAPPTPLEAIVELRVDDAAPTVRSETLHGAEALACVAANMYRGEFLHAVYRSAAFTWAAELTANARVYRVSRPASAWTVDEVSEAVVRCAASGE